MCSHSLQLFCNRIIDNGVLTRIDARELASEILPDGITNRDEADMLLALERAVPTDAGFADYLVAEVVDYVVWIERATGIVDAEAGLWLATSIAGRAGPTATGARIAREVIREADATEEALIAFALDANGWTRRATDSASVRLALAA